MAWPRRRDDSFRHIYGASKRFEDCIIRVASFSYERADTTELLRQLRFLVVPQNDTPPPMSNMTVARCACQHTSVQYMPPSIRQQQLDQGASSESSSSSSSVQTQDCKCCKLAAFSSADRSSPSHRGERSVLRLTSPGEMAGCNHFLAVSYTWEQPASALRQYAQSPGYDILTAGGRRRNRAPVNVLDRAIEYAAAQNLRCIWIDQECIDQEDNADKENHVQAMDEIYRNAQQVVTVLSHPTVSQHQVSSFEVLEDRGYFAIPKLGMWGLRASGIGGDEGKVLQKLLDDVGTDRWYTRAWTYQEAIVARSTVHVLLPCEPGTRRPDWMGAMPCQIILDLWVLAENCNASYGGRARIRNVCPQYKTPSLSSTLTSNATHRLGCVDACAVLSELGLSEDIDRVAIIANLCRYTHRLDARAIKKHGFHIDTVIYTQALLNGDLSCILTDELLQGVHRLEVTSEPWYLRGHSWCPLPSYPLPDLQRHQQVLKLGLGGWGRPMTHPGCRISPLMPTPQGLRCSGLLVQLHRVDFGDFSCSYSDFMHLSNHLEVNEFNFEKLSRALDSIIRAFDAAELYALSRAVIDAAEACGIWLPGTRDCTTSLQAAIDANVHRALPETAEQHLWCSRVRTVKLAPQRPVTQRESRALDFLYLILSSAVRERLWQVGIIGKQKINCSGRLSFICAADGKFLDVGTGVGRTIFVPKRVLIHSESELGAADRLPFWQVKVHNSVAGVFRLECAWRIGVIWEAAKWQDLFFWGDWALWSSFEGKEYVLI